MRRRRRLDPQQWRHRRHRRARGRLTKDAFLAKANEICKQGDQSINQDGQQFFKSLGLKQGDRPTSEQVEQFATQTAIPKIQAQITAIEALPAPSGDEDQVDGDHSTPRRRLSTR